MSPDDHLTAHERIMRQATLGELEHLVLLAVWRLGDRAYGLTVRDELAQLTDRRLSVSAVYLTLARLAKKGFLNDRTSEARAEPGGRARRMFQISDRGRKALYREREVLDTLWEGLPLAE